MDRLALWVQLDRWDRVALSALRVQWGRWDRSSRLDLLDPSAQRPSSWFRVALWGLLAQLDLPGPWHL